MKKKPKNSQKSGGARLIEAKKKPVLLGLTEAQHKKISDAAEADGRKITQFLTHYGLKAAEIILEKM